MRGAHYNTGVDDRQCDRRPPTKVASAVRLCLPGWIIPVWIAIPSLKSGLSRSVVIVSCFLLVKVCVLLC